VATRSQRLLSRYFLLFSNRAAGNCMFTFAYNDVLRLFIFAVVIVLNNTVMELNLIYRCSNKHFVLRRYVAELWYVIVWIER